MEKQNCIHTVCDEPQAGEDWRAVRYLYDYGENELMEWVQYAKARQARGEQCTNIHEA
ncbi:DUF72 domain-containing protein [Salicibibacter halophilus]|uniref:hypothetical protein n=1 Tax=Salicibibacter halophilus TaxID=2502791 RepID=UPI00135A2CE1|nr:hypothetical protein [Salicibibacter halophilus]